MTASATSDATSPTLFAEPGPRVFAAPPGLPFADALAAGVARRMSGRGPLALADVTLAVSTRRLGRAVRSAFARQAGGAAFGPRLTTLDALGDADFGAPILDLESPPPAIADLRRLLYLTQLVRALLDRMPELGAPASAPALASDLAALLDDCAASGVSVAALATLESDRHALHWEPTRRFLELIAAAWPAILTEERRSDRAARRAALVDRLETLWTSAPPLGPVIVAGAPTDRAAERLFALAAQLPQGAVVIPGLDRELDPAAEAALIGGRAPEHPQAAIAGLLGRLGMRPGDATLWAEDPRSDAGPRRRMLAQALRPAPVTDAWTTARDTLAADAHDATERLSLMEAASPREEAAAIAIALRGAIETPGRTAALITPDRSLARRVSAELARWGVRADDSSGRPLALTPPGVFHLGCARAVVTGLAPAQLLDVLKHPLAGAGAVRGPHLRRTRRLERDVLRGKRPRPGAEGLRSLIREHVEACASDDEARAEAEEMAAWAEDVLAGLKPLLDCAERDAAPLSEWVEAHRAAAVALSSQRAEPEAEPVSPLFDRAAGEALRDFLDELAAESDAFGDVSAADYPGLLGALIADRAVREPYGLHPRVSILGALEARMQSADLVVLAGLNEGVWPRIPEPDSWISRDMRSALGLPPLEAAIGLAAHDFSLAAMAPEAILSRARKADGAPTTPSRWLMRLETLLQGVAPDRLAAMRDRGDGWLRLARRLDASDADPAAAALRPARRPQPKPPIDARPTQYGATEVETLIRDPYAVYARKVLRLRPLPPLDDQPDARDRGELLHRIVERYVAATLVDAPADAEAVYDRIVTETLAPIAGWPTLHAFWTARAAQVRSWFLATESERRRDGAPVALETFGQRVLDTELGDVWITAKADRIDWIDGRGYAIYDYKTGSPPTPKQQRAFAKQLPLEAAILGEAGFENAPPDRVAKLAYLSLTGRAVGGVETPAAVDDPGAAAEEAVEGVARLVSAYADPERGYPARSRPALLIHEGDYDHLARLGEWRDGDER